MEMFSNAALGDLASRSVSFVLDKCNKQATSNDQEDLQRLHNLLLRCGTIIEEAQRRHVTSRAMLQQLRALWNETLRGYYIVDTVRCRAALEGEDRRRNGKDDDNDDDGGEVGRRVFVLSRFNPVKRFRGFPSGASETKPLGLGGANLVELRQVVRNLEILTGDMKEFVVFLMSYPPLYRQPYSAHMFVERCMFGRHMEKATVMEFLLGSELPGAENLAVLPIVGPAHIGKSTLVEHVCDDERVCGHFSLILFYTGTDLKDVTTSSFKDRCVIKHRRENYSEERLLVVIELLEDVDDKTWNKLRSSQRSIVGAQGGKTIVTSRSEKVVRFGTTQALRLKCLPAEAYWYLFRMAAFGSDDPGQHPKMTSLAMEMASVMQGSFMFACIGAALLKDHFDARSWYRVLTRLKQYLQKNVSVIGEYPDEVKAKDHPRFTWNLVKPEPDKYFMLHDIYQRGSAQDEVPKISFLDLLAGTDDQPQGEYEILFWKSRIPPYFNYICTCEIRDM